MDGAAPSVFDQVTLLQFLHDPGEGARAVLQLEESRVRRDVNDQNLKLNDQCSWPCDTCTHYCFTVYKHVTQHKNLRQTT